MKKIIAGTVALGLLVLAPVNMAAASTSPVVKTTTCKIVVSGSVGQKQTSQQNTVKTPVVKVVKTTTINLQKNSQGTNTSSPKTPSTSPETKPSTPVVIVTQPKTTNPTPAPAPTPAPTPSTEVTADEFSAMQREMLNYINEERAKANLAPLVLDRALSAGAYEKSKDMAVNNYFSHTSPTYGSPFEMMKARGISYRMAAENIAKNTSVKGAHTAFMNSSGHRANILNSGFKKIGIGIYQQGRYLYITQWFTN